MSDMHRSLDRALEDPKTPRWGVSSEGAGECPSLTSDPQPTEHATPPSEVILTPAEYEQLAEASWQGGRGGWISKTEVAAVQSIIAARLAVAGGRDA